MTPERREDFYRRLALRHSERTGLPIETCREAAEAINRGEPSEHRTEILVTGLQMIRDAANRKRTSGLN